MGNSLPSKSLLFSQLFYLESYMLEGVVTSNIGFFGWQRRFYQVFSAAYKDFLGNCLIVV